MREINILDIDNIKIGHAQSFDGGTGCTVIIAPKGAYAGVDIRGGGPASRETPLLNPVSGTEKIHAILLSGGSAFGLDAAGGVMDYLEKKGIGFDVGVTKVPLVCQSCIFDLAIGDKKSRPTKEMAFKACENAWTNEKPRQGCIGAGTGATVGKLLGGEQCMKSGIGMYAVDINGLKVGAIAVVNALGDVFNSQGKKIAGLLNKEHTDFLSSEQIMYESIEPKDNLFVTNTTICCVITNAAFDKAQMNKIAAFAQNGVARSINPVHTTADGDTVYALSTGEIKADINTVGTLSARVLSQAIENGVKNATGMYGLKAMCDLHF